MTIHAAHILTTPPAGGAPQVIVMTHETARAVARVVEVHDVPHSGDLGAAVDVLAAAGWQPVELDGAAQLGAGYWLADVEPSID